MAIQAKQIIRKTNRNLGIEKWAYCLRFREVGKITTSFSFEARGEDSSVFQVARGIVRARTSGEWWTADNWIEDVWTRPARQRPAMLRSFSALSLFSGIRWILSSPMSTTVSFFRHRIDEYLSFPLGRPPHSTSSSKIPEVPPRPISAGINHTCRPWNRRQPISKTLPPARCLSGNREIFEVDNIVDSFLGSMRSTRKNLNEIAICDWIDFAE